MYETMRYWDEEHSDWGEAEQDYAAAWRSLPKWVVSRSMKFVGPNATLVRNDVGTTIHRLKTGHDGIIEVAGPGLAGSLIELGLVDEYRLYFHPLVLGGGKPFFSAPPPPLRLVANDRISEQVVRLTYAHAR